jgi:catechol 2,3-dioxygenase-like lactoylglutathione lyase family enzyme
MPLTELNHYLVRTNDLDRARRFYCEMLGFHAAARLSVRGAGVTVRPRAGSVAAT